MAQTDTSGAQFMAEATQVDDEERIAREVLERKARERQAASQQADALVVDEAAKPEDDQLHMELAANAEQHSDGELYDKRTGDRLEWNEDGLLRVAKAWPHRTVTYQGTKWEYRDPKKLALMFMSLSSNTKTSPKRRMEAMLGFLEHCLSDRSMDQMIARAFDHDDEFDTEHMGRLMQYITSRVEGDQDQAMLDAAAEKKRKTELE